MHFSTLVSALSIASVALAAPAPWNYGSHQPKCPHITAPYAKTVVSQFTTDGIVPDLIEATTLGTPTVRVNVNYNGKQVNLGKWCAPI